MDKEYSELYMMGEIKKLKDSIDIILSGNLQNTGSVSDILHAQVMLVVAECLVSIYSEMERTGPPKIEETPVEADVQTYPMDISREDAQQVVDQGQVDDTAHIEHLPEEDD